MRSLTGSVGRLDPARMAGDLLGDVCATEVRRPHAKRRLTNQGDPIAVGSTSLSLPRPTDALTSLAPRRRQRGGNDQDDSDASVSVSAGQRMGKLIVLKPA